MSTNESEVKEPLAFMLLWRPWDSISGEGFDWHDEDLPALVESIASGVPARSNWSVSNFPRLIGQGDRVFLRRTSSRPVGLVAEGVVASEVYTAPSYKDNGRDMSSVDIDWLALAPDDPLGPEGLRDTIPALTTRWAGAIYDPSELEALDTAWASSSDGPSGLIRCPRGPTHADQTSRGAHVSGTVPASRPRRPWRPVLLLRYPGGVDPGCGTSRRPRRWWSSDR